MFEPPAPPFTVENDSGSGVRTVPTEEWSPGDEAAFRAHVRAVDAELRRGAVRLAARRHWPEQGSPWIGHRPGPELAAAVSGRLADPGLAADQLLDCIDALDRCVAALQASRTDAVARFLDGEARRPQGRALDPMKSAKAELELLLKLSPTATENLVGRATALAQLPSTMEAFRAGAITEAAAQVIADQTSHLEPEHKRAVEEKLFPNAFTHTAPRLKREVLRAIAEVDPELLKQRHAEERKRRDVHLATCPHGMSRLTAYLPADIAQQVYGVIRAHAKTLRADGRSFEERKADALTELILNPRNRPKPKVSTQIRVVVPVGSVLGLTDEAGYLAGYGPVPADLARELALNGTWRRLLTDPASGEVLDYGTTRYRPTAALIERIVARAGDCDAPECVMPAHHCDADHVVPHRGDGRGGATSEDNLKPRCQHHHDVKGLPGWKVTNNPDGTSTWRTPHGRTYVSKPSGFIPKRR